MVFKISEICKQYGDNIVLENISLELQGGKVHGILGYNGAGKSTSVSYTHLDVYKRQAPVVGELWIL